METIETNFNQFAEFLFRHEHPPAPNTLRLQIEFEDDSMFSDFLYDLFTYGYRKKFDSVPNKDLNIHHFETIRDYLRSIGTETILYGYHTDETTGEVVNIKISFAPYTAGL